MTRFSSLVLGVILAACGGTAGGGIPDDPTKAPPGGGPGDPPAPGQPTPGDPSKPDPTAGGNVIIHVRATAKAVPHTDGYAGQTPRDEHLGIRGLLLYTSKNDPNPLVVFDNGAFVEARLNDGDDTVVAKVPAAKLRAGTYTWARTLVTHARYKVDATAHYMGFATPGEFENLLVLSDNTDVKGKKRKSGDLESTFRGGGQTYGPTDLTTPIPRWESAGIALEIEGGQASYVYPAIVTVDPTIKKDVNVVFELNMHECFRWEDQPTWGYTKGVWDTEISTYEPLKQFGANSFKLTLE
jgi:hypothetical protein